MKIVAAVQTGWQKCRLICHEKDWLCDL